jgi:hypothetical protein
MGKNDLLNEQLEKIKRWSQILEINDNTVGIGDTSIPPGYRDSVGEVSDIRTGTDLGATDQMSGYMDMGENDNVPSTGDDVVSHLNRLKASYDKIQRMVDAEALRVMSISLSEIIDSPEMASQMENKLEAAADNVEKLNEYYTDLVDRYHETIGYDDPNVSQMHTINMKLVNRQLDLMDISNLWYKYKNMAEDINNLYTSSSKRLKTLINLKRNEI